MKITKRQLQRIIKEEKAKLLNEYTPAPARSATEILADLHEALDELIGAIGFQEAADEMRGLADELHEEARGEREGW